VCVRTLEIAVNLLLCRTLASLAVLVLVHQSYTSVNWQSGGPAASAGRALLSLRSSHPNAFFGVTESLPQWAKCAICSVRLPAGHRFAMCTRVMVQPCQSQGFVTAADVLPCRTAGVWLGYVSSVFYLSSRLSQIYKNYARKCTEGLSVAMFLMAISANVRATCRLAFSNAASSVALPTSEP
jgi:PQ loop repeat